MAYFGLVILTLASCVSPGETRTDTITVMGHVTARGNEPFSEYVLETDQGTIYVLKFPPDKREGLSTPATIEVTGHVYLADWGGIPFAHLEVFTWEEIP